ncbi:MAG: hypothetical protein QM728_12655 [Gordonia sp. (in: high G+C Gram-positive bacteria)]|uniref:hypothetical protein n=1 Tax=Gordonia sp. (in: high G+C Gram-positive bacteria) TaxID=84139 RepID=UPI0039E463F4
MKTESLTHAYRRAFDAVPDIWVDTPADDPAAREFEAVERWDRSHRLRNAAVRGTVLPDISIGNGSDGPEISCEPRTWVQGSTYFTGREWAWRLAPLDLHEFFAWLEGRS